MLILSSGPAGVTGLRGARTHSPFSLSRSCVSWMTLSPSYGAPCSSTTFSVVSETKSSSRVTGASHQVPQQHLVPSKPLPQIPLFPLLPASPALHRPGRTANACVCWGGKGRSVSQPAAVYTQPAVTSSSPCLCMNGTYTPTLTLPLHHRLQ